jgi:hypothetical protein
MIGMPSKIRYVTEYRLPCTPVSIKADKTVDVNRYVGLPPARSNVIMDGVVFRTGNGVFEGEEFVVRLYPGPNLRTKKGNPTRSPQMVLKFFNSLRDSGWTIRNRDAFIRANFKNLWSKQIEVERCKDIGAIHVEHVRRKSTLKNTTCSISTAVT